MLIENERVPAGQQRARQGGHHNGVVNIADHALAGRLVDDDDVHAGTVPAGHMHLGGGPPGRKLGRNDGVDNAIAVRAHRVSLPGDLDVDLVERQGRRDEVAPATHAVFDDGCQSATVDEFLARGQDDAGQHTHPGGGAVAGKREDGRLIACCLTAATTMPLPMAMQPGRKLIGSGHTPSLA